MTEPANESLASPRAVGPGDYPGLAAHEELPPPVSTNQRILRRFLRHRMAVGALVVLAFLYLTMLLGPFLAPYGEATENRQRSFMPPTRVYVDGGGLYVRNATITVDPNSGAEVLQVDRAVKYRLKLFLAGDEYRLLGFLPARTHLFGVEAPAGIYLFGTDQAGRDIFSRTLYGASISLTVGIMAIFIVIPLGMLIGGISGYFGGWIDNILMRIVEALMSFPSFYLLLFLFGVTYKWDITPTQRYVLIVGILSLIGWTSLARVIRGQVLALRAQEYVEASLAAGASSLWVITKHILPQTATWVTISASMMVPNFILGESALSMIGLGVQQPAASWGNLLQDAMAISSLTLHPWLMIPALFIVVTVVAFNFCGDGVRDAFDAKSRV
ncbi:MAG: ABC transporter permease [Candidatus Sericytochromatia bacterium]|nr:ABC transporter permease [Candidatus Sericytochromatia bacterium]